MEKTELRRAVRAMTAMIRNGEWAEHVSKDPDARALEDAITQMHNELAEAQAAGGGDDTPPVDPLNQAVQSFIASYITKYGEPAGARKGEPSFSSVRVSAPMHADVRALIEAQATNVTRSNHV